MNDVLLAQNGIAGCDMYDIGICDDGKNICSSIENMLMQCAEEKKAQFNIQIWYTGEGLRDYLAQGGHLDILFLDIELYKMTGIEVGGYIRKELDNIGLQIIYISGKSTYAQQLFKTQPLDFLVKPITQEQINDTMETALKVIKRKNEKFEFQKGGDYYYIPVGDIIYFESMGRKVKIVAMQETYEFYGRLKEVTKRLPEDFIIIHKSFVINTQQVFHYTYEAVKMTNGTMLVISQIKRKQVRETLLKEKYHV